MPKTYQNKIMTMHELISYICSTMTFVDSINKEYHRAELFLKLRWCTLLFMEGHERDFLSWVLVIVYSRHNFMYLCRVYFYPIYCCNIGQFNSSISLWCVQTYTFIINWDAWTIHSDAAFSGRKWASCYDYVMDSSTCSLKFVWIQRLEWKHRRFCSFIVIFMGERI